MVEKIKNSDKITENTILEEIGKGYYYNDKVIRPSRVKIAQFCE